MNIGEIINRGLQKKKMSQTDLSEVIKVSRPGITQWISGKNKPTAEKLIEVIDVLDLVEEFFPKYQKRTEMSEVKSFLRQERKNMQTEFMNLCNLKQEMIDHNVPGFIVDNLVKVMDNLSQRIGRFNQKFGSQITHSHQSQSASIESVLPNMSSSEIEEIKTRLSKIEDKLEKM